MTDEPITVDDPMFPPEPGKPFRVYRTDIKNEAYELEGAYATAHETLRHPWRLDRNYKITGPRGKYMTRTEFEEWVKRNDAQPPVEG